MIERPIWRDYAAFSIISNAATSSQFNRGFQIARSIEQPEARTNALIRLAEGQALNARPNEATAAYEEAARSVTLIPQEDPRETLVGVLIDSLISFGRFDDARACVPLYSFPSRQLTALSRRSPSRKGRRNLAEVRPGNGSLTKTRRSSHCSIARSTTASSPRSSRTGARISPIAAGVVARNQRSPIDCRRTTDRETDSAVRLAFETSSASIEYHPHSADRDPSAPQHLG